MTFWCGSMVCEVMEFQSERLERPFFKGTKPEMIIVLFSFSFIMQLIMDLVFLAGFCEIKAMCFLRILLSESSSISSALKLIPTTKVSLLPERLWFKAPTL
ncbi:hypothetical protein XENORESO_001336 [Xenotaenia resolanae]|uniref:Uncharacterized protein n=1 Tax=Xenotaenia resolanae TaxID=208358 RepID=A0ABV0W721_9TELE